MDVNFRFIDGSDLNNEQINEVTKLLFDTGYYEESALNNKLNLPALDFHRETAIIPALAYIRALVDLNSRIVAFHLCLTKNETIKLFNKLPNYYEDSFDNVQALSIIDKVYTLDSKSYDLIRHNSCISPNMRGRGLLKLLLLDQISIAKVKNCNRIFSCTWESNINSIAIFKHYGAKVINVLDFTHTKYYNDRLINLAVNISELEKTLCP